MAPSQDSVSLADAWWPVPVSGSPPALSRSSMTGPSRLLPMRVPLGVSWSRPLAFDPPSNPASTDTDLGDLPIHNQAIQGVQKPLEDITDSPDIAAAEPSIQLKDSGWI
ncbi:hypothetical protein SORBI_3008G191850 [Sorghum bicolor]|uniref:Uncharacterized protein n=1 Tax=Sorghum bicolor TaxID=4558 RepID=A0A1Z5R8G3_SORBI|nr:hypothetical protein SORBI_3008G191850 [Sorghum bicolor]